MTRPLSATPHGTLFVWTDIDPAHEGDFNLWYDREHMEERVRIPGMPWARRYRARGAGRKYLAIYHTDSLDTFQSDAYRAAFTRQTDWSNQNFARMTNTQRRVMAVTAQSGFGAGAALAMAELADDTDLDGLMPALTALTERPEVLRIQVMRPDPDLSTPLPSEAPGPRVMRPVVLVDVTSGAAADTLTTELPALLGSHTHAATAFDLIWSLDAADLPARQG